MNQDDKTKARRAEMYRFIKQKEEVQERFEANVALEAVVTQRKQIIVRLNFTVTQNKRL